MTEPVTYDEVMDYHPSYEDVRHNVTLSPQEALALAIDAARAHSRCVTSRGHQRFAALLDLAVETLEGELRYDV